MENVLFGLIGMLLALALLTAGVLFGYKLAEYKHNTKPVVKEAGEDERRRLIAEQNAFQILMGYNPEMAYGQLAPQDMVYEGGGQGE